MKRRLRVRIPDAREILLELDDSQSPGTVGALLGGLPFEAKLHVWGGEIYTSESPVSHPEEDARSAVNLHDVAYWPPGKAVCLFYGPTPVGDGDRIIPASPVNIVGRILSPDRSVLSRADGRTATFEAA